MKRYTLVKFHDPRSSNGRYYREKPYRAPTLTLGPMAYPLKIKILKFRFLHVTRGMKRDTLAKFHDPRSSNDRDYREQPYRAPILTLGLMAALLEN